MQGDRIKKGRTNDQSFACLQTPGRAATLKESQVTCFADQKPCPGLVPAARRISRRAARLARQLGVVAFLSDRVYLNIHVEPNRLTRRADASSLARAAQSSVMSVKTG